MKNGLPLEFDRIERVLAEFEMQVRHHVLDCADCANIPDNLNDSVQNIVRARSALGDALDSYKAAHLRPTKKRSYEHANHD